MSKVSEVTDQTFHEKVVASEKPVAIDFWAPWCMPCNMMSPIFEEVAGSYDGNINFYKLNTDANQATAVKYGIMSIPSLLIFKDGKEVSRMIGVQSAERLKSELNKVL